MTSWSCRYELGGLCKKVSGAYCRPGMKGCVLVGKVKFEDGVVPAPVWPDGAGTSGRGGPSGAPGGGGGPESA